MATPPTSTWTDRRVMLLVAGTTFMEIFDGTILAIAAPRMAHHFGVAPQQIAVAITAYLVTLAVLIPLSGWLADRFGSRRVFVAGIVLFTVASGLCAASQSLGALVALRVLQGVGGALMVPVGRMVVLRATDRSGLVRAVAFLTWPALVAPVIAPIAGGAITTYLSWRWIFLINVPLGIVAVTCALRLVPQSAGEIRGGLDWAGFALSTTCLAGVVVAAAALGSPRVDWVLVAVAGSAAALCGVAAVRHLLTASDPLLDLRVFRIDTFRMSHTSGSLFRCTIMAVPFLLPLLFEDGFRWSPVKSGAVLLFLFVGNLTIKPLIGADTPLPAVAALLVVSGAARSVGFTAYTTIAFADIEPQAMRHANTIASTAQQVAIGVGVALAAVALRVGSWATPALGTGSATPAYRTAFMIVAAVTLLAAFQAMRLRRDGGAALLPARAG